MKNDRGVWPQVTGRATRDIDLSVRRSLRISLLLALAVLIINCAGCASVERFTEDHPQAVVVVSGVVLVAGGIVLANGIAKSGRTQVVAQPRTNLGPP